MGLLVWLSWGCIFDGTPFEQRVAELTDHDGDGVPRESDCDDADGSVHPGAPERCDGLDQDCDGQFDEEAIDADLWHPDEDRDGFGALDSAAVESCSRPDGYTGDATDCDDGQAGVHPGAEEVPYDGVDQDCTGADLTDVDGDGSEGSAAGGGDCNDLDAAIHPDAHDVPYDGIDQDCSGADADDLDEDGAVRADDCDDADPSRHPGAPETWADGLTDNDCDGELEPVELLFGADAWTGVAAGDQVGRRVARLGDVTEDGLAEYLVGAAYEGSVYANGGAVYVVPGGASAGGLGTTVAIYAGGADWYLATALDGGVDANGDGLPEAVVTATGYESFAGAVFLVDGASLASGPAIHLPEDAWSVVGGESPGESCGAAAQLVGDVVGDGGEYLAIGSLFADPLDRADAGVVTVIDARVPGSRTVADGVMAVAGPYAGAAIGNVLMSAGDIDADGIDDLLVGVEYGDVAYVLPGGAASPSLPDEALFRLAGADGHTAAVRMLGDVDGDGRRDLAAIVDESRVEIYTSLVGDPVRVLGEPNAWVEPGEGAAVYDLLDLGDLDADGRAETWVPSQWDPVRLTSSAALIFGSQLSAGSRVDTAEADLVAVSSRISSRFGYRNALSADVDGDGGPDIVIGGYSDSEAGESAGAVLTVPVPR